MTSGTDIDCRIHDLRILGHKLKNEEDEVDEEDEECASVPTVIVSNSPEVKEESLQARQEQQQRIAAREQAGGIRRWWGRVFKKRDHEGGPKTKSQVCVSGAMICRYIDEGVVRSDVGLFLIGGHWPKILPQTSKGAS